MGQLQPGVGYNLIQSPHGDCLEILFPPQKEIEPLQFEIFKRGKLPTDTETSAQRIAVASGRVMGSAYPYDTKFFTFEYNVDNFNIFPVGSYSAGSITNSKFVSQNGTVKITNASEDGADRWLICLVRLTDQGNTTDHVPQLAVIGLSSDADNKSRPFISGYDDSVTWCTKITTNTVDVVTPTGTESLTLLTDSSIGMVNYNCQRLMIGDLTWNSGSQSWDLKQYLIGSLTFPNNIQTLLSLTWDSSSGSPAPWASFPAYNTERTDWQGSWSGYTKNYTSNFIQPFGV